MIFNSYEIIQHASFFTQTGHFIIFVDVVRLSQGPAVRKFTDTMPKWWFYITINVQLAPNTAVTQCAAQPLILSGQLWLFTCRMRRGASTSFPKVMGAQHFRKPACTIASPPTLFLLIYNPIFPEEIAWVLLQGFLFPATQHTWVNFREKPKVWQ